VAAAVTGVGLHSGETCRAYLHRDDGPLRFRRGRAEVVARVTNVAATDRAVTLAADGARVSLVEHLLAALRLRGFYTGVVVETSAEELPILDGSAAPWLEAVAALGEPPEAPPPLVPAAPVEVALGASLARVEPGDERLDVSIEFAHPAIGAQRWSGGPKDYAELASARTFGFLGEAESLRARGLVRGASLEHAIVFADDGPLRPLRFPDEPVRHKALDAIGDLALLGRPLQAHVTLQRGSHRLHHALMSLLLSASELPERDRERPVRP
jgi:UDP-3-O-[3-hydroxymyristoyl] N-acetylglucosamine deacetylase